MGGFRLPRANEGVVSMDIDAASWTVRCKFERVYRDALSELILGFCTEQLLEDDSTSSPQPGMASQRWLQGHTERGEAAR